LKHFAGNCLLFAPKIVGCAKSFLPRTSSAGRIIRESPGRLPIPNMSNELRGALGLKPLWPIPAAGRDLSKEEREENEAAQ
jgi:hypothetical protein